MSYDSLYVFISSFARKQLVVRKLLKLSHPFKSLGTRFWEIDKDIFLCYSSVEQSDENGIIVLRGWQLVTNSLKSYFPAISLSRQVAGKLLNGLIAVKEEKNLIGEYSANNQRF